MMNISKMFVIISKAIASADRIVEVIDTPEDMLISECTRLYDDSYIRFDNVTFSYNNIKPNLENINFTLHKGETLGIIGATGSGKSTIAQLLMRYYDVNEGSIYIEGENIKSLPIKTLRNKFGVVFQNDTIFEDTISENVRLGREITDNDIKEAIKSARAKEFVEEEGRGYDNHINIRGANLSGGQKQRILIARALAGKPDILILDDSSSALDYKTDAALRSELSRAYKDTTKIIIAQRVSSILHADLILVLDEGRIIGSGTHDTLIKTCDIYRQISNSQIGGE
jgi:ATP-binding cassette subfamily B protein